jgi:UDP-N-acetylmuramate dehydrogenase
VVSAKIKGRKEDPGFIRSKMRKNQNSRSQTQPMKEKTCGSTFKNPSIPTKSDSIDKFHQIKAWSLIDKVGLKGFNLGGAAVSSLHSNFLINTGTATATEIETLGEYIRAKVLEETSIKLEWEVKRVGIRGKEKEL